MLDYKPHFLFDLIDWTGFIPRVAFREMHRFADEVPRGTQRRVRAFLVHLFLQFPHPRPVESRRSLYDVAFAFAKLINSGCMCNIRGFTPHLP